MGNKNRKKVYDVVLTFPDIVAKDKDEAVYLAREKAKIADLGYVRITEVEI